MDAATLDRTHELAGNGAAPPPFPPATPDPASLARAATEEPPAAKGPEEKAKEALAIAEMFAADFEPEIVTVPGHPESWFQLLPMPAEQYKRTVFRLQAASASDGEAMLVFENSIIRGTVVDYSLRRKAKPALDPATMKPIPGEFVTGETTRPPAVPRHDPAWDKYLVGLLKEFSTPMHEWLARECARVSGGTADVGK